MSSDDNETSRFWWLVWIAVVLAVPWLPLWAFFTKRGTFVLIFWPAYGVILLFSLLLAQAKSTTSGWKSSWSGSTMLKGIGYSILGTIISAVVGFAGCAMAALSHL